MDARKSLSRPSATSNRAGYRWRKGRRERGFRGGKAERRPVEEEEVGGRRVKGEEEEEMVEGLVEERNVLRLRTPAPPMSSSVR
jgi:hypothetical protein